MNDNSNTTPPDQPPAKTTMFFTLVLAEVIFETVDGIASRRVQFVSEAPDTLFPADRIGQLQNSAARVVKGGLPEKIQQGFQVHDVLLHALHPLGEMTPQLFFARTGELDRISDKTPVAAPATGAGDNVVAMRKPDPTNPLQ